MEENRLFKCLVCQSLSCIPQEWLRKGGNLYEKAVEKFPLTDGIALSFPYDGVSAKYDGASDSLVVLEVSGCRCMYNTVLSSLHFVSNTSALYSLPFFSPLLHLSTSFLLFPSRSPFPIPSFYLFSFPPPSSLLPFPSPSSSIFSLSFPPPSTLSPLLISDVPIVSVYSVLYLEVVK